MEKAKPKKRGNIKDTSQENVPLHDIVNMKHGDDFKDGSPKHKKRFRRKNEISPEVVSSSIATITSQSFSPQDAWEGGENIPQSTAKDESGASSEGVVNHTLFIHDEMELPGSVPDLQNSSIHVLPAKVSQTVIDDDASTAKLGSSEMQQELMEKNSKKSKFHRGLFDRPNYGTKSPSHDKENNARPSTAPGQQNPFSAEFNLNSSFERPATATGIHQTKSRDIRLPDSVPPLEEKPFTVSARTLKNPKEVTDQVIPYVPYMQARNTLSQVITDMTNMKLKYISIMTQIEGQYKSIESDSKDQFQEFVLSLQEEQKNKMNSFRQSVEMHNKEIKERNKYWHDALQSLSKRNKELMRQKRALLLAYNSEKRMLVKESGEIQPKLMGPDLKSKDPNLVIIPAPTVHESKLKEDCDTDILKQEKIHELEEELLQVKSLLASSGTSTQQERVVYEEKIKEQSRELARVTANYEATIRFLHSIMASVNSEEQFMAAMNQIKDDRAMMIEEQNKLLHEINVWEDEWKKNNNGILPQEDEKPDAAKELDTQMSEVEFMLSNLNQQEEALIMLKEGRTPLAKADLPEPIVTTVEVQDPNLVQELETSKALISTLEEKVKSFQSGHTTLSEEKESNMHGQKNYTEGAAGLVAAANVEDSDELIAARKEIDDLKQQLEAARSSAVALNSENEDFEALVKKLDDYKNIADSLDFELRNTKAQCDDLSAENASLQSDLDTLRADFTRNEENVNAAVAAATLVLKTALNDKELEVEECRTAIENLEKARLENLDIDSKTEIEKAKKETKAASINAANLKKEKDQMVIDLMTKDKKITSLTDKVADQVALEAKLRKDLELARAEKQKSVEECERRYAEKERKRKSEEDEKVKMFKNKIRILEATAVGGAAVRGSTTIVSGVNTEKKIERLQSEIAAMKQLKADDQKRIKELEEELKGARFQAKGGIADKDKKVTDKKLKDLEKKLDMEIRKFEREQKRANDSSHELDLLKKAHSSLENEYSALNKQCEQLKVAAATGAAMVTKVADLETENKQLSVEVKALTDNYNTERVLRKKYYNMVEDMKGKIRVYCRYRPMSKTEKANKNRPVVKAPDEYTVQVEARGNVKEFQFDQVFTSDSTQEQVFEDTYNLVQSAVDGYNVCIFAYGQTGSGKTYTMIGDSDQTQPGIAPRAFRRIFDLIEENKDKMKFQVSCYMLELYNENLVDLLATKGSGDAKLDIKKDKKGMVFVQGSTVIRAASSEELNKIFEKGSSSRHVASTKMNSESSRSHLVVAVILESTNLTTGAVTRGKLSLVDLAGSERVGKTGATAQQLKEANSINKSLSALGDVISALSSEQSFIPYRNNKLTMLMQDSLGGNAKTLMFVNISPADYNADETAISLTYASRVKLITNDASKNAESKEVARLRAMVAKLKAGEAVDDDD